jgi:antitoxin FitA
MATMIQLRNVPDSLHRQLKARAALEGLSLSDFLIREARKVIAQPTIEELRARIASRTSVTVRTSPAQAMREERDSR